jgi:hypothetical protein
VVRIHLVDEYGAALSAVTGEIGSRIAIDIEFAHHSHPVTGDFHTDVRTVLPFHVTSRGKPTFTESNRGMHTSSKSSAWLASFYFRASGQLPRNQRPE